MLFQDSFRAETRIAVASKEEQHYTEERSWGRGVWKSKTMERTKRKARCRLCQKWFIRDTMPTWYTSNKRGQQQPYRVCNKCAKRISPLLVERNRGFMMSISSMQNDLERLKEKIKRENEVMPH
jgi:hypothetical protein